MSFSIHHGSHSNDTDRRDTHYSNGSSHGKQTGHSFLTHKRQHHANHAEKRGSTEPGASYGSGDGTDLASEIEQARQLIASLNTMIQNAGYAGLTSDDLNGGGWPNDEQDAYSQFLPQHHHPGKAAVSTSARVESQPPSAPVSQGTTIDYNPFVNYSTQCTYGAMNLVLHETGGKAPDLTRNADQWDAQARSQGWTVVDSNPTPGSIAVFQPNSQYADGTYGHVAVVVSVDPKNHKAVIEEMNNPVLGGPGKYNFREVDTNCPGTDFIEIPPDEITNPLSATQTMAA